LVGLAFSISITKNIDADKGVEGGVEVLKIRL
jgi:hypothetical protein